MSLKSEFYPMNNDEEGAVLRKRSSIDGRSRECRYLTIGLTSVAVVIFVCGLAVGLLDNSSKQKDVPPLSSFSMTHSSLCGIAYGNTSSPVICFTEHKNTPTGDYRMVSHSSTHACAISTDDTAICWGTACDMIEPVDANTTVYANSTACPKWLQSHTEETYTIVVVEESITCLLRQTDGTAACYGDMPVPSGLASMEFVDLTIVNGLACGVTGTSQLMCWDTAGNVLLVPALSGGVLQASASPMPPQPAPEPETSRARRFVPVNNHTNPADVHIACAVSFLGDLYCTHAPVNETWVVNATTNATMSTPVPEWSHIRENSTFERVSINSGRGCGLTTTGSIECFSLVDHIDPFPTMPLELQLLVNFTDVIVTESVACGLAASYDLHCWGNVYQLGPVRLPDLPKLPPSLASSLDSGNGTVSYSASTVTSTTGSGNATAPRPMRVPCPAGTRRVRDGSCADIDECRAGTFICPQWSYCVNTYGSQECPCYPGYNKTHDGSCMDIDECALGMHDCHVNATCTNWYGRYWCTCKHGFEGDGLHCVDVDECTRGTHNCDVNAYCNNTIGDFYCTCNEGYGGNGTYCANIDECAENTHLCHINATCTDTIGSYNCTCAGLTNGDGFFCDDDQCALDTDDCPLLAYCTDTVPGFNCTCIDGYDGDGYTCNNVDECVLGIDNCHPNATCNDTVGSFDCTCNMFWLGNGTYCDLDECAADVHNCHEQATCNNTDPGFFCTCNWGWDGSGVNCSDVDECVLGTYDCRANSYCNNTIGNYTCPCSDYFRDDGINCNDINECAEMKDNCQLDVACTNLPGYFRCECAANRTDQNITMPADVERFIGMAQADGRPIFVVAGRNISGIMAYIFWCTDHACNTYTTYEVPELFEEAPDAAADSSGTVILAGRPLSSQVLLYRYCADVGCTDTATRRIPRAGYRTRVAVDANDTIVIMTSSITTLKVMHCYTYQCEWANREVNETAEAQSPYLDMTLTPDGRPIITYLDSAGFGVFTCMDHYCDNITSSDYSGPDGFESFITMRADGRAVVAWRQQSTKDLMFGVCSDMNCTHLDYKKLTNGGRFPTIDLRPWDWLHPGDYPVITHLRLNSARKVELLTCTDPECEGFERLELQANGNGQSVGVYYNDHSNYLYTMDEHGALGDGFRLSQHCFTH